MDKFDRVVTSRGRTAVGVAVLLAGAGLLVACSGHFPGVLDAARAPLWVILAVGSALFLAGAGVLLQGWAPAWAAGLNANLLWTLFAVIPAWIAWGQGGRSFSGSVSGLADFLGFDSQSMARFAFALSAIALGAIAAVSWWRWLGSLERRLLPGVVPSLALAGYLLFFVLPAEPQSDGASDDHARLARYALLSEREGWLANKASVPIHWKFPPWRNFELWTRAARSRLAAVRTAPQGVLVHAIPRTGKAPLLDGGIGSEEWRGALRIALGPRSIGSTVLLMSDGTRLYLAADVPSDTTKIGYDQFRVWFHLDLSPWLESERVFLDRGGRTLSMRTVRVPDADKRPRSRTDWRIFERARGATRVAGHRTYELELDLEEAGIRPGVPFPARLEIEGDPILNGAGKFRQRRSLGEAGSFDAPLWLRVGG